ncbi:MAG TPA: HAMP domain-containing sensor histidine kinase [Ideonella sp.]|uniref:sensor histidine kinase n=1 Tax=Ideonella sp. TaxID=1929293 RepID=UPI002C7591E8|nr:HAMP domain-containing sensor histidine kinase [Ideonella sp.]HSI49846.1 HAMP domain-containing sensor histidine kinase [Ideonella sp.]
MRLSNFIISHLDEILVEWVAFARCQLPAAANLDDAALLDHGKLILEEIVADMGRPLQEDERQAKSEGNSATASESADVPSRSHARQRERQGFHIEQLVAEYRALRATVFRLWSASSGPAQREDLEEFARFNEAVDQAIAESLQVFVAEVDKARDLFLGMLGHDLRGPLSTIASCANLHRRSRPNDSPHTPVLLRSVAQMKALLDDLVEYTRHRLGSGLPIDPADLQLDQFARETLDEIAAISGGRELALEVRGDLRGEWDARRLHQVLSNLVVNALKYGLPDAPIRICLDGTRADEVILAVENTGKPIPKRLLPTLFDPLVRAAGEDWEADSPVAGANLGLGLYVVREIATAHGGTVEVTSNENATRFALRLPRVSARVSSPGQ